MKKLASLLSLLVFLGCLMLPPVCSGAEIAITEENLPQLKGKWEGYRRGVGHVAMMGAGETRIMELESKLEIFNDELPLKGELIYYNVREGGNQSVFFDNGVIEKGKLFLRWGSYWLHLTLHVSERKMELRGQDVHYWDLFLEKINFNKK